MREIFSFFAFTSLAYALLSAWCCLPALAQNAGTSALNFKGVPLQSSSQATDPMAKALQLFDQLDPASQKRLLAESKYAESYCKGNTMLGNFYDCSCFSLHMLAERLDKEPDIPFVNLVESAHYQACAAAPQIAGFGDGRCLQVLAHGNIPDAALQKICACAGRALATNFAATGSPDMEQTINQFDSGVIGCREQSGY